MMGQSVQNNSKAENEESHHLSILLIFAELPICPSRKTF